MEPVRGVASSLAYLKKLADASVEGIRSTRQETDGTQNLPPLEPAVWRPAAIGATFGFVGTRWIGRRKSARSAAVGALAGSLVGLSVAFAWSVRRLVGPAANAARKELDLVRDAHWLETHPINYG